MDLLHVHHTCRSMIAPTWTICRGSTPFRWEPKGHYSTSQVNNTNTLLVPNQQYVKLIDKNMIYDKCQWVPKEHKTFPLKTFSCYQTTINNHSSIKLVNFYLSFYCLQAHFHQTSSVFIWYGLYKYWRYLELFRGVPFIPFIGRFRVKLFKSGFRQTESSCLERSSVMLIRITREIFVYCL